MMIGSFSDEEAQRILDRECSRKFSGLELIIRRKLIAIESALALSDLKEPPGNRLEALQGSRKGSYSIRVNRQYRICFRWEGNHAYEIKIVDYH